MTGFYLVTSLVVFSILYAAQLYFHRSFLMKLINVTVLVFIASAVYFTFETYKGWPTVERIQSGMVVSIVIERPVPNKSEGAIYVWMLPQKKQLNWFERIFVYSPTTIGTPRSYLLPYSKEADEKFSEAKQRMANGEMVFLTDPKEGEEAEGENKQGKDKQKKSGSGGELEDYDVPFLSIVPPDKILRKD